MEPDLTPAEKGYAIRNFVEKHYKAYFEQLFQAGKEKAAAIAQIDFTRLNRPDSTDVLDREMKALERLSDKCSNLEWIVHNWLCVVRVAAVDFDMPRGSVDVASLDLHSEPVWQYCRRAIISVLMKQVKVLDDEVRYAERRLQEANNTFRAQTEEDSFGFPSMIGPDPSIVGSAELELIKMRTRQGEWKCLLEYALNTFLLPVESVDFPLTFPGYDLMSCK
jgi:hypothetical protein